MNPLPTDTAADPPRGLAAFLLFSAALTGALVMVVEVLGSRVIGPFFGVSLFVWTALITVTLLALALGYAVGGAIADRHPSPALLYLLIGAAGVLVCLVPLAKAPVLTATLPLGLRVGTLASAALLFGPALFLLGCVSPLVVRIAAREWQRLGRTVGIFYAVSTAGSFAGTVFTGFFLIAYVGVSKALFLAGVLLLALSALYFATFGGRRVALLAPLLALALAPDTSVPPVTLPDGTRASVLHSEDSYYGTIRVVDYRYGERHQREMIIDGLVQGGVDMRSGRSVYEYTYLLQWLPVALHPQGRSCLVIGVGAGIVPSWYESRGVHTDVVDIDPQVVAVARRHFAYAPRGEVHLVDARWFIGQPGRRYDYVILDVFNGDTTPGHLLSVEALRLLRQRLAPGGVLAVNMVGELEPGAEMTEAVIATLRAVFDTVELYPVFDVGRAQAWGNVVVAAYGGPRRALTGDGPRDVHPMAESLLRRVWGRPLDWPASGDTPLLTDDFNPLDVRDIRVKEGVRRQILRTTPAELLVRG